MEMDIVEVLIHKKLSGAISPSEEAKLTVWLSENEANQQSYDELSTIWQFATVDENDLLPVNVEQGLASLSTRIKDDGIVEEDMLGKTVKMPKKRRSIPWMKIAAGFVLLLGVAMLARVFSPSGDRQFVERTEAGEVQTLDMLDGSTILLNASTEVVFFPQIKSERRMNLKGEAFFDVARDESKPFIIETPNAYIEVLGTSFNVNATTDNSTEVAVRSGKVMVTPKNGQPSKVLTKGQSVILSNDFQEVQAVTASKALQGYDGFLVFKDTKLNEVFSKLHLKFGHRFQWEVSALKDCGLNATFDDKTLTEIMAILKTVFNIEAITISDELVILRGGQCN